MSSIISNRKFLIKSPNEILHDKIEELIEENKKEALDKSTISHVGLDFIKKANKDSFVGRHEETPNEIKQNLRFTEEEGEKKKKKE